LIHQHRPVGSVADGLQVDPAVIAFATRNA